MDFQKLMKQAKDMQDQMVKAQAQWAELETEGSAGGGLVRVVVDGHGRMKKITIDPSLLVPEEVDILEDVIRAACQDAHTRSNQQMQDKMSTMMGGMGLPPGFQFPFGK
jgi:DNA-binding YbaB/EbfC family protein